LNLLRKCAEELREESNEAVRKRIRHIWGMHPAGARVTDIL